MTEKMPSSVSVGSRSSARTIRLYSSRVSPCRSRTCWSMVMWFLRADGPFMCQRGHHRFEQDETVSAAERALTGALRMRHEADDIPALAADAGDVVQRSIRIGG